MFKGIRKPGSGRMGLGKKIVATVLFGTICLVFVFLDMGPGQFGNFAAGGAAAVVNSKVISIYDFRERVRRLEEQFGGNFNSLPAAQRQVFTRNIRERALEELINFEVLSQSAETIGVVATDQAISNSIVSIPAFQEDGKFRRERYDMYLQSTRLSAADFEQRVADEVIFTRVRDLFNKSLKADSLLMDKNAQLQNTKVNIEYLQFTESSLKSNLQASAKEIADFQKNHAAKIQSYYDGNKDEFTSKVETRARHILIKSNPGKKGDDERALARIKEIQEELKTADFGELAKKYSEDAGSKAKNGDLGFFAKGRMVKEFEEVAFSLPVGNVSGPVKSNFGYHIIKVEGRRGGDLSPLEKVSDQIAQNLIKGELFQNKLNEIREALKAGQGKTISQLAKANKLKWEETGDFEISRAYLPKLGDKESLLMAALKLKPGQLSSQLESVGSNYYVVKLKSLKTTKPDKEALPPDLVASANEAFGEWATSAKKDFNISRNGKLLGSQQSTQ